MIKLMHNKIKGTQEETVSNLWLRTYER